MPVPASRTLAVLSWLPVIIQRPSGEKAPAQTQLLWPERVNCSRPVDESHSRAVESIWQVRIRWPSGENATDKTAFVTATVETGLALSRLNRHRALPVEISHRIAVLSQLPVTTRRPSGESATEETGPSCAARVRMGLPLAESHIFAVRSSLPVTINLSSLVLIVERVGDDGCSF